MNKPESFINNNQIIPRISTDDVEEIITFNKEIEIVRGRDPMEVFMKGNCGSHHNILSDALGSLHVAPFLAENWSGEIREHVVSRVHNVARGVKLKQMLEKNSMTKAEGLVGFFDVSGVLDWFTPEQWGNGECKMLPKVGRNLAYGYSKDGNCGPWQRDVEEERMNNNRKLIRLFMKSRKTGLKVDIEKELYNLGDHRI